MKKSEATLAGIVAGLIALTAGGSANSANIQCSARERCYGVVKAGANDCATATSACAGTSKQDFQKDAWVYLPKGTCEKLGGTLKPGTGTVGRKVGQ